MNVAASSQPMKKLNHLLAERFGLPTDHELMWSAQHSGGNSPVEIDVTIHLTMEADEFDSLVTQSYV